MMYQSVLFLSMDIVATHIWLVHCLLATPGHTERPYHLAGWLWMTGQWQKVHFLWYLHILGRKWRSWDESRSGHTCTTAGVMSLVRPQMISQGWIKTLTIFWTALVQIWRLFIVIQWIEYSGTLKNITYRGEWVLRCLDLQEQKHAVLAEVIRSSIKPL